MKRIAILVALVVVAPLASPPGPAALWALDGPKDGEIKAVSVVPGSGKVEVVIDLQGAVEVRDFTLSGPARLVVDLVGARLGAPAVLYDGQNRGGIKNVRYAQFRPDVVRVVIELDALRDYRVDARDGQVRVELGTDRGGFAAWTSRSLAAAPAAAASAPRVERSAMTGGPATAGRVAPPRAGKPMTIAEYLAAHANEAAQSQAPRITVQWDAASIEEVVAGFAAFSGRTIVLGKGVSGNLTAEIKNQPWDLAFNAVLESQGLGHQVLPGGIIHVLNKADLGRADSTVPLETRLVRINYARASSLQPSVQSIVTKPRGQVVADSTTNSLVITEVATRIDQVEAFVKGLDIRTPQVSIQAKIIFVDDAVVVGLDAGLTFERSLAALVERAPRFGRLPDARRLLADLALGRSLPDALRGFGGDGDDARVAALVVAATRFGAPLAELLVIQADALRTTERRRAEAAARRLPVLMLFPLSLTILPALLVVFLGPPLLSLLSG